MALADVLIVGEAQVWDEHAQQWRGHMVTLSEDDGTGPLGRAPMREVGNIAVVGPPGAGKGMWILTQLLNWQQSVLCIDLKGETYELTKDFRASLGDVFVFNVREPTGHRFNPLRVIPRESWYDLALNLVTRGQTVSGDARFWANAAVQVWLSLWYAAESVSAPHIPYAVELMQLPLPQMLQYILDYHSNDMMTMRYIQQFLGNSLDQRYVNMLIENGLPKLLDSKWSSAVESTVEFTPELLRVFSGHDLDPARMFKRTITIYIMADENKPQIFAAFSRLVIKGIGDALINTGDKLKFEERMPVLFLFDEFGAIKVNSARTWLNTMRSRGVILTLFVQNLQDLPSSHGENYDPADENAIHHWIVFATPDTSNKAAKFISNLSGTYTERVISGETLSRNIVDTSPSINQGVSHAYRERTNVRQEDIDEWYSNQSAVSVRPNGRQRRFYAPVDTANPHTLKLFDRARGLKPAPELPKGGIYVSSLLGVPSSPIRKEDGDRLLERQLKYSDLEE